MHSEIRYDDVEMPNELREVGQVLRERGRVAFNYACFGTGHKLHVIDASFFGGCEFPPGWGGPGIGAYENNAYSLWITEGGSTGRSYWFPRGQPPTPNYVAEKLGKDNLIDGFGLAVMILLVEAGRSPTPIHFEEIIDRWWEHFPEVAQSREKPAFMEGARA